MGDFANLSYATALGLLFMAVYIPNCCTVNLASTINEENGFGPLGFIMIGSMYLGLMIGSFICVAMTVKIGVKKTFTLGGVLLSTMAFVQMMVYINDDAMHGLISFGLIIGSMASGFGQALMWIAQGEYIGKCATAKTQGFYVGYFWALYNISQAVGNLLGGDLLADVSGTIFFLTMGMAMAVISLGFLCLGDPTPLEAESAHEEEEEDKRSLWQFIVETWQMTISPKMCIVNPGSSMCGISIAFYVGLLVPIMVLQQKHDERYSHLDEQQQTSNALFAMVPFGVAEVVGSIIEGQIIDKLGNKTAIMFNLLVISVTIITVCLNIWTLRFGVHSFLMCGCWGLLDTVFNVQIFRTLCFEFESHSLPFGSYHIMLGVSVFLGSMIQSMISEDSQA